MNQNNFNYGFNYPINTGINYQQKQNMNQDERFVGGFAFPFLLGGVTGAAIAPAFFGGYNRPPYYNNYYYQPYPGPYYPRTYRPF